ncbi:MAG: DUF2066 domain-containing protein [Thalassobaculaceae bacterium]|nr:DUF2066 domain-containing protein [Thalassobaculaceae bacterium]
MLHRSILLASLVLLAVSFGDTSASAQDIYTVRGVPVDVTADGPSAAREQAVREGRRKAFERLVSRLVPGGSARAVAQRSDSELANLALGFEVADERTSAVRYIASMTYSFDPGRVRSLLMSAGVQFAETRSLPVLVIPVLDSGGGPILWEEGNPFRAAWSNTTIETGLVPFVVPYGDIADVRDLTTGQATSGDEKALGRIAERYGARDAVVVEATPRAGGAVEISVERIGPSGFGTTLVETVTPAADAGGGDAARYVAAVRRTVDLIEDAWKQDNLIRGGLESRVTVTVPIDSMRRWLAVREALEKTVVISRYDVVQLTRVEALVDLWVNGDAEQLRVALEQRNMRLLPGAGDYMLIQRGQDIPVPKPDDGVTAPGTVPGTAPGYTVPLAPASSAPPSGTPGTVPPAPGGVAPLTAPTSG